MQIIAAAASFLALAAAVIAQDALHIDTVSIAQCLPSQLTFGGGTPPYTLSAFPAGVTSGNPLQLIATAVSGTSFTWNSPLPAGQTITLGIRDNVGATQFSSQITISTGTTTCPNATSVASAPAGSTSAAAGSTTAAGATSATGATTTGAASGTTGATTAASGSSSRAASSAASASTPSASGNSALSLSAGPAAIIGMVLGAFLA